MHELTPIVSSHLPSIAEGELRTLIISGTLRPRQRLTERDLASQLGVSRTPVREALMQLQREGLVTGHSGRGLLVSDLSSREITAVYQILAALERAALLHTSEVEPSAIERLKAASQRRAAAGASVDALIAADLEWHRALTCSTSNAGILELLERQRALAERYERAFFKEAQNQLRSMGEHAEIEQLTSAGQMSRAAELIERHWLSNLAPMLEAIESASAEERSE